jgi:NAD(P)-dependent dehydrogenase (short-subunit alcohol dehydrogenase family)
MSSIRLDGKVAIVTGATKGIGRAITMALASAGALIVGSARNAEPAKEVLEDVKRAGGSFAFVKADVSAWEDCQRLAATALADHGRVDILVNNAGTSLPQVRVDKLTEEDWRAVIGVTLEGTVFMSRAVLPSMIENKDGVIINIASTAGVQTAGTMGAYAAAKAAVIQLTKVIAVENIRNGVRANALLVGSTDTELRRAAHSSFVATHLRPFEAGAASTGSDPERTPSRLLMAAEGVATAVRLLCLEDAREINGSTITIDRGLLAGFGHQVLIEAVANGALTIA